MVDLSSDERLQLDAYLKYPDRITRDPERLYAESSRGIDTHRQEINWQWTFRRYLRRVLDYNNALAATQNCAGSKAVQKPGRPPDVDVDGDRKIYDAWQSGRYKTFAELAVALNRSVRDVKKAIDRHRKRVRAQE